MLANINCKVNLIALNPGPGIPFETPLPERVASFQEVCGGRCPVLFTNARGLDIAACGAVEEESGMTVVVPHHSTQQAVISTLDQASDQLLGGGIRNLVIVDQRKTWNGPVMTFSFTGQLGYISVPLAGRSR